MTLQGKTNTTVCQGATLSKYLFDAKCDSERQAHGFVIVFDFTRKETFENLTKWIL